MFGIRNCVNFLLRNTSIFNPPVRNCNQELSKTGLKVTIVGAAGSTGQALALLLKNCPMFDVIALFDVLSTKALAMDFNLIDTKPKVISYNNELKDALEGSSIVVVTAANSKMAGCDPDAVFNANAKILYNVAFQIALYSPHAIVAIATNPINSLVPMVSEVLRKYGALNPKKVFGITTMNTMQTNILIANSQGLSPENVIVPTIGGHSDKTVVPVLSRVYPDCKFTEAQMVQLTKLIQTYNKAKSETYNPASCLPGAFAISRFIQSIVRAMKGETNIVECAYVHAKLYADLDYFSVPVQLGINGMQVDMGIPPLSDYEKCLLQTAYPYLKEDIIKGKKYAGVKKKAIPAFDCTKNPCAPH